MTDYKQGDVILVRFVFTDDSGTKRRPAVIISSDEYHRQRREIIISAITSNTERILFGDYLLSGWKEAGLLFPSVATAITRTVKQSMIERRLGSMLIDDLHSFQDRLRNAIGL